ncbi:MAG: hypothetical protein KC656_29455, partial [Myxococcales bacterium]|nr:hypothetical protein [Myxococcales bacterium]
MRIAAVVAVLAGCGPEPVVWDHEALVEAFEALHTPIYDVYAVGTARDALHDHLAARFTGEALTDQYVEHWRTLVAMEQDQTGITVTGVEYEDVVVVDDGRDGRLRVDASWLVRGIVRHQQHRHPRINRYRAIYTLAPTPDGLRIVATRMKDLERVATQVASDALFDEAEGSG